MVLNESKQDCKVNVQNLKKLREAIYQKSDEVSFSSGITVIAEDSEQSASVNAMNHLSIVVNNVGEQVK